MFDIPINEPVAIACDQSTMICGKVLHYKVHRFDELHSSFIHIRLEQCDYFISFDDLEKARIVVHGVPKALYSPVRNTK